MTAELIGDASDDAEPLSVGAEAEVVNLEVARLAAEEEARRLAEEERKLAVHERNTSLAEADFGAWAETGKLDYFRWAGRMGYGPVLTEGFQSYRQSWLGLLATSRAAQQQAS